MSMLNEVEILDGVLIFILLICLLGVVGYIIERFLDCRKR